jgi:phosphoribosylformylglycinamidine synthase
VKVCVINGHGINADEELALAFEMAGASARRIHAGDLARDPSMLSGFQIVALPGGFSFGDHLGSGKVFATLFRRSLGPALGRLVGAGGLIIGVCNGFQALVKMGLLPDIAGTQTQEVSLIHNDSGRFEDRWVRVAFEAGSRCIWTRGLPQIDLPVRHGEGKLVVKSQSVLEALEVRGLVALHYVCQTSNSCAEVRYPDDPNGSVNHIAGLCDPTGRVLGLMPHPEAFLYPENHPNWTTRRPFEGGGLAIFRNGVRALGH